VTHLSNVQTARVLHNLYQNSKVTTVEFVQLVANVEKKVKKMIQNLNVKNISKVKKMKCVNLGTGLIIQKNEGMVKLKKKNMM